MTKDLPILMKSKSTKVNKDFPEFPLDHYSYSSFTKRCNNPIMFKIEYLNHDRIDTTTNASSVLGSAVHKGLQAYLGGEPDQVTPADEGEAIKFGHDWGLQYLTAYSEGFVKYSKQAIPDRQTLMEKYAYCYFGYIKEFNYAKIAKRVLMVEKKMEHYIEVDGQYMPIKLKGYADFVYEDHEDRICIVDHKIVGKYSDVDSIDGSKLLQAAFMYFLVYKETGKQPYSMTYREFKHVPNADKSPQTREYTIVFKEVPMMFEFFFRLYQDITNSLMGQDVYLPNLNAMFDKEVSIMAYIYRLDVQEERNKAFKQMKVDNLTDFLKKKIQNTGSMKKYLETVQKTFISAKSLNYKDMTTEERIKMKLAEFGLGMDFDSKIVGGAVTLYKYEPSIGLKMSKIEGYVKDVEQAVEVSGIRVLAPIPNSGLIGFEVPNTDRTFPTEAASNLGFSLAMGTDIMGNVMYMDLRDAPHTLIAGATGSGKSVCLNSIIKQLQKVNGAHMHLFDPKMVELAPYRGTTNVKMYESDPERILGALEQLVCEMNKRYEALQAQGKRNVEGMGIPYIFAIIDEYGDLVNQKGMIKTPDGERISVSMEIRRVVLLLAQKARAAGIHLILTTQRPSVKIIDGDIKANFPTRIAFRVATSTDSMVIIDQQGAEKLLGKGDMLVSTSEGITRLQGYNA